MPVEPTSKGVSAVGAAVAVATSSKEDTAITSSNSNNSRSLAGTKEAMDSKAATICLNLGTVNPPAATASQSLKEFHPSSTVATGTGNHSNTLRAMVSQRRNLLPELLLQSGNLQRPRMVKCTTTTKERVRRRGKNQRECRKENLTLHWLLFKVYHVCSECWCRLALTTLGFAALLEMMCVVVEHCRWNCGLST
jgi:hypothetical protein